VLGVCYGLQVINVHRGGTLIQHIPDAVPNALQHENRDGNHNVEIVDGTRLSSLAGKRVHSVNSTHHQAVDHPGRDLVITARAGDGVIEALECTLPRRLLLAVQWHPERIWRDHPLSSRLFQEFISETTARR
jgi:putative glutamine amidotransferase